MTRAVQAAKRARIPFEIHEYEHQAGERGYGGEAARKLGVAPQRVFKTLGACMDADPRRLAVAIVPVASQLDLRQLAAALQVKKVAMGPVDDAERATGYVTGGVSPLGQRKRLPTVLDRSWSGVGTEFVSAGGRGLEIEPAPADLAALCVAIPLPFRNSHRRARYPGWKPRHLKTVRPASMNAVPMTE